MSTLTRFLFYFEGCINNKYVAKTACPLAGQLECQSNIQRWFESGHCYNCTIICYAPWTQKIPLWDDNSESGDWDYQNKNAPSDMISPHCPIFSCSSWNLIN